MDYVLSSRNLGIAMIGSVLRNEGYTVKIINPMINNMTIEETVSEIKQDKYDIIGFSIIGEDGYKFDREIIKVLLESDDISKIIIGGIYATFNATSILEEFKNCNILCICAGEGEEVVVELINNLYYDQKIDNIKNLYILRDDKIIFTGLRKNITNLDHIKFGADDEAVACKENKLPYNIQSSRGCYGVCSYCSCIDLFYGQKGWRCRSANNVVDEIEGIYKKYGIKTFSFIDENFIGPGQLGKNRAINICNEIIRRELNIEYFLECRPDGLDEEVCNALSKSGCKLVFLGLESGSNEVLKELNRSTCNKDVNKNAVDLLTKYKIEISPGYIMVTPNITLSQLKESMEFFRYVINKRFISNIINMRITTLITSELIITDNTKVYRYLKSNGRLNDGNTYYCQDEQVEKLRRYIKQKKLPYFVQEIENKIRKSFIDKEKLKYKGYRDTISEIRKYENSLVNLVVDYLIYIIKNINNISKKDLEKSTFNLKENLVIFQKNVVYKINNIKNQNYHN